MRGDVMQWIGRLVAIVFGLGVLALMGSVVVVLRQAEGVPPLPIFLGLSGLVVLILLAGASLALISLAVSARRGAAALERVAASGTAWPPGEAGPEATSPEGTGSDKDRTEGGGPSGSPDLPQAPAASSRPARRLVAER